MKRVLERIKPVLAVIGIVIVLYFVVWGLFTLRGLGINMSTK